jgi:class 3 adenylate cyclase
VSRSDHQLATVLFTDIVDSSSIATELGDRRWRVALSRHHALVRRQIRRYGGRELDTAGDGFFIMFSDQADAIRCACAISDAVRELGIEVRAGLNVGQAEKLGKTLGGIVVHTGARVMSAATGGEVLVSGVLHDLVPGSGFEFSDRGNHHLKGIPREVRLYAVVGVDGTRRTPRIDAGEARRRRGVIEQPPLLERTRGRVGIWAGAVALLLAAGLGAFVVTRGPEGGGAAVRLAPPNTLVRIDPGTNRVVGKPISLARGPSQIAVVGGSVWVISSTARVLEQVDPENEQVVKLIHLPATPTGVAGGASGSVWVALGLDNRLVQYKPQGGGTLQESPRLGCCAGPGLVAVNSHGVYVSSNDGVRSIDPTTGNSVSIVGRGNAGIAVEPFQSVWIANGWDGVERANPAIPGAGVVVPVSGGPSGLAYGAEFAWAASRYLGTVSEISPETASVNTTIPVGKDPCCVAVGAGAVWVANSADGTVVRVDPVTAAVTNTIHVGSRLGGITVGAGGVWVTTQSPLAKDRVAGTLAFSDHGNVTLESANGTGRRELTSTGVDNDPSWSPDGSTLVFTRGHNFGAHLFTTRADGTDLRQLIGGRVTGIDPAWSPDGRDIAFLRGTNDSNDVWVVRPDGTGLRNVTRQKAAYGFPAWTPDGSAITVFRYALPNYAPTQAITIRPDGTHRNSLWFVPDTAFAPAWSPSGDVIAFGDSQDGLGIRVAGRSGTASTQLAGLPPPGNPQGSLGPSWSPDGTAIAFGGAGPTPGDIYIMNSDGTGLSRLSSDGQVGPPAWRPTR